VIFGFAESQGTSLAAHGNGTDGIFVANGSLSVFGGGPFAGGFAISASNNRDNGFVLALDGTIVSPGPAATFTSEHNRTGLNVGDGSRILIVGGLKVQNNQTGLLADGAGTLTLVSIPANPSSILNNSGTDVDLRFGTRATFDGVSIGTIVCDATVLSRGSTTCP
jgi:hypothetical protein